MKRRNLAIAAIALTLCVAIALLHPVWFGWMGNALVKSQTPEKADAALVLAGDYRGARIEFAAGLVRDGFVPKVLVSGPMPVYGINEADLAINYAVSRGFARDWFEPMYISALSTEDEALTYGALVDRRGMKRILLVTSNYHSARAVKLFRDKFPKAITIIPVAAPDKYFGPGNWWQTREGQKTFFFEATKTIAERMGL